MSVEAGRSGGGGAPEDLKAPITEHLRELRKHVVRAALVLFVGFCVAWAFREPLFDWLIAPYAKAMLELFPDQPQYIQFRGLVEPIAVYLKTSLLVAVVATVPYVLLELWLFVVPGLYERERKLGVWFLLFTLIFFYSGVAFGRYAVLDTAVHVLLGFGGSNTSPMIMMQEYFGFASRFLLLFGAIFELPIAVAFLSLVGLLTHRHLIRYWRYAILGIFVIAGVVTPPDPFTQIALGIPMCFLYVLSIGVAWMFTRRREQAADLAEAGEASQEEAG